MAGKSYAVCDFYISQFMKYGRPFYWLRLTEAGTRKLLNNNAEIRALNEQYDKREARGFVESKFSGSLKQFLVAFTGNKTLSKDEVKELKEWLDEFEC